MKIWFVIFLSESAFTVWQACSVRGRSDAVTKGIGPWFAAACLSQVSVLCYTRVLPWYSYHGVSSILVAPCFFCDFLFLYSSADG